jgi:hypothetical protein
LASTPGLDPSDGLAHLDALAAQVIFQPIRALISGVHQGSRRLESAVQCFVCVALSLVTTMDESAPL